MASRAAAIAANRFGLGARPGEIDAASREPKAWLLGQLNGLTPQPTGALRSGAEMLAEYRPPRGRQQDAPQTPAAAQAAITQAVERGREVLLREAAARLALAIATPASFRERLVWFWSNHFTVSGLGKARVLPLAGVFEREAIRPHVTGRFRAMLGAVVRHPAMLIYLDNAQSVGPNSPAGLRREVGLNENLARELLELHTLGVQGGYTQADVEQLARMLTGWSVSREPGEGDATGFLFRPRIHEPGSKRLLGHSFVEAGEAEVTAALDLLASQPSTAKHVATKLARHFIADQPPADSVARLAKAFTDSDGDLPTLYRALLDDPNAWGQQMAKLKTPAELMVSAARAYGGEGVEPDRMARLLHQFAHVPYTAPSPAGFPDIADAWAGPEMVMERLEWCAAVGRRMAQLDPVRLSTTALGSTLRPEVAEAIRQAPSAAIGIGLLLAAPEFQRR
jgi:uncharacterized protein (DUF1800 family)